MNMNAPRQIDDVEAMEIMQRMPRDRDYRCDEARGNCYLFSTLRFTLTKPTAGPSYLVQGICRESVPPYDEFGHCWIEVKYADGWYVVDPLFPNKVIPREDYYMIGRVRRDKIFRYTRAQAIRHMLSKNYVGAWSHTVMAAAHRTDPDTDRIRREVLGGGAK